MIVQKMKRVNADNYELAERYYSIVSALNNLKLTQREVQLVAHTAVRGNISYAPIKEDFCTKYGTSVQTINNIISKLRKSNVFVKDGGKIKVNPVILLKFENDIVLQISLTHGK